MTSYILQSFPDSSVIKEDGQGHLIAGDITGSSILKISAVEPFGITQNLVIGVQVGSNAQEHCLRHIKQSH